ncbi:MAG: acetyl-CoA carboxylase biotin carboxylase subunit [Deltaproteobacteria bacterium]|nr:acetyl-CoA carboxylase biotin carboxylase subunit [Deltaproteobacteria bacterium]
MKSILIANRGEIAVRIIRTCRDMGLRSVAVFSEVDRDALHVQFADEAYCIGPGPASKSYLSIPAILSVAYVAKVDAIHPGYGFLSENAEFARICEECGFIFIGPRPAEMKALGDKVSARRIARAAGVPTLEGSEPLLSVDDALARAGAVGFPVLFKAGAGGGGRGMRVARDDREVAAFFPVVESEAKAAFGDSAVYVEKYLEAARHIEVQVVGDARGNVVHLFERDCSIQRRHQKVIEEAPAHGLTAKDRETLGGYAVKLLKETGYRNAGTLEFLRNGDGKFYFLEMNTRLQVEHPVTEAVTGVDLVGWQIAVARGEALPLKQGDIALSGHAIEFRINAEDSERFRPSSGRLETWRPPGGPGVRLDAGVAAGAVVSPHYDSLLAKLIVSGATRDEAMARAVRALREFEATGIATNISLHARVVAEEKWRRGDVTTRYLEPAR